MHFYNLKLRSYTDIFGRLWGQGEEIEHPRLSALLWVGWSSSISIELASKCPKRGLRGYSSSNH